MNNKISLQDILATIQEWELQASSPYNDGWVIQGYKDKLEMLREHVEVNKEPRVIT